MGANHADIILVGASLSHCLLAWFIKQRHPEIRILIFERESGIPGRRTWSFHRSDVGHNYEMISELITSQWAGYEVRLPDLYRSFDSTYCTIRPDHLQSCIVQKLGDSVIFSSPVDEVHELSVRLADGNVFWANCVLDSRNDLGWAGQTGYQKFVGLHVTLAEPHKLSRPILMDARVPQVDGYRFFYTLPLSSTGLLVEDTRYSANPHLDLDLFKTEIESFAAAKGWTIRSVDDCESGVLPIPLSADDFKSNRGFKVGMAGGFFHPVTGYSLPSAVELADRISRLKEFTSKHVLDEISSFRADRARSVKFFCLLNKMMFRAAKPHERYKIFEHFYSLPEDTIQRFYAGSIQIQDCMRLLCAKPPVKISAAFRSVLSEGVSL